MLHSTANNDHDVAVREAQQACVHPTVGSGHEDDHVSDTTAVRALTATSCQSECAQKGSNNKAPWLQARLLARIMLHDDLTIPYLVTMINRGCHIPWLQRGGALRGRPHKTYNKRIVSNSAAGPARYTTERIQYTVNDASSLGISAHSNFHYAAAHSVPHSSHSPMRRGTGNQHVVHYLGHILHQ